MSIWDVILFTMSFDNFENSDVIIMKTIRVFKKNSLKNTLTRQLIVTRLMFPKYYYCNIKT